MSKTFPMLHTSLPLVLALLHLSTPCLFDLSPPPDSLRSELALQSAGLNPLRPLQHPLGVIHQHWDTHRMLFHAPIRVDHPPSHMVRYHRLGILRLARLLHHREC